MWFVLLFHLMILVVRACMRKIDFTCAPFQHGTLIGGLVTPKSSLVEGVVSEGVKIINIEASGPVMSTLGDVLRSGVVFDAANSQFNVSMTTIAHNLSSLLSPLVTANDTIIDGIATNTTTDTIIQSNHTSTTMMNTTSISSNPNPFQGLQAYADLNWYVWLTMMVIMPLVGIIITITVNQQDDKAYRRYLQFLRLEFDTRLGMHSPR